MSAPYRFCIGRKGRENQKLQLINQRITNRRSHIAAALPASRHYHRHACRQDQFFRLHHIDKSHRYADNQPGADFSLLYQFIEPYQGSRRIADGKIKSSCMAAALSMLTAALVVCCAKAAAATSSSAIKQCTFPPYFSSFFLFMPALPIFVSVMMDTPSLRACSPFSTAFSEKTGYPHS